MPSPSTLSTAVDRVRRAVGVSPEPASDAALLARFVAGRDAEAFAELVRRHGPAVRAACRRVTADPHLADDAFQATFLVLVRRAAAVHPRAAVGGWLHGVAVRCSLEARTVAARRRVRETATPLPPDVADPPAVDRPDADALRLLEVEIGRLPDPLRAAVVLCELEGRSRRDVAAALGVPEGTLSSRLAAARKRLAGRLRGRGVALAAAGVVVVPSSLFASAAGLAACPGSASAVASDISKRVLHAMLLTKLKAVTAGVAVVLGGFVGWAVVAADGPKPPAAPPAAAGAKPAAADTNVLKNGGCEAGDKTPDHWTEGAEVDGVTYRWDKATARGGKASLCLDKSAKRYFPIAQWYQAVDRTGGKPALKVSAQVKADAVTKAILDVQFLDDKGEFVGHQWAAYVGAKEAADPPVSHDWKEYAGRVAIPKGTKKLAVALQIYGPGKVWFDDVHAAYAD